MTGASDPWGLGPEIPEQVAAGELRWITILVSDDYGYPADGEDVCAYSESRDYWDLPLIADDEEDPLFEYAGATGVPAFLRLDADGVLVDHGYSEVLDHYLGED